MDGGSTDETSSVVARYGEQLHWISERDRGQAHAINKGLQMASGEIVAFLNSDDLYEPGALLTVGRFFARHPEAMWVTGRCRIIDQNGRDVRGGIRFYKDVWLPLRSYNVLLVLNYISQPATFWRKRVLDELGSLDEDLHYTMDYDYWLRIGRRSRLFFLNRCLAAFRTHESSKSSIGARAQFDEELAVARRYTSSRFLLGLHSVHRELVLWVYDHLHARERGRADGYSR
jgi:glycosyltransferase involved in cell wall biosynthesis